LPARGGPSDTARDNKKRPQQQEGKVPITRHSHNRIRTSAAAPPARVEAHPFSAPGDPLAVEPAGDGNGWTFGQAIRAVRVRRRFVVRTQVADMQVCPSDDVDQGVTRA